jgi:hypothetical protein
MTSPWLSLFVSLESIFKFFSGCIIKIWFSVEHLTKGLAFYCIDACCRFHSFISVKQVHIWCAQVVCTFGSMVFASILLVRGIWSGVTYIRENRYSYIHRIDNDENRWSRVQTAGWYFAFLLYEQRPHPALAGNIVQKEKDIGAPWSAMNKIKCSPFQCQLLRLLLLDPAAERGWNESTCTCTE